MTWRTSTPTFSAGRRLKGVPTCAQCTASPLSEQVVCRHHVLGPLRQFPAGGSPRNQTARRKRYEEISLPAGLCAGTSARVRGYTAVKQFELGYRPDIDTAKQQHIRSDANSQRTDRNIITNLRYQQQQRGRADANPKRIEERSHAEQCKHQRYGERQRR